MKSFTEFAKKLGVSFKNENLLTEALTHRSYLNENRGVVTAHNERLEFLGDAVLELATTRFLFDKFPAKPEGELTAFRAALVNTNSLAESASALGVNDVILLSKGEAKDIGRARMIILANAFEALIGAVYLDQGYESAESFIGRNLFGKIDAIIENKTYQDPKSCFQEKAQEKKGITPSYNTLSEVGPDHEKVFTVGVFLNGKEAARAEGPSKQEAEQAAAQEALNALRW